MTKLDKSVRATIRDVVEKQSSQLSPEMAAISWSTLREHLRDEHGIRIRTRTLRDFATTSRLAPR